MINKKYIVGVRRDSGSWCYAPNVTDHAMPLFTFNRCAAQEFINPEAAKTWWVKVHKLFYEYERKVPCFKWETLSIIELIESESVFEQL